MSVGLVRKAGTLPNVKHFAVPEFSKRPDRKINFMHNKPVLEI
jgi:hypothetical protein